MSFNQQDVFNFLRKFSGAQNILAVPRFFIAVMNNDIEGALFLSQLLYWNDKSVNDGWVYKTYNDWYEETGLNEYKVRRIRKHLEELGWLETKIKKANGNPTVHYRLTQIFVEDIIKIVKETNNQNKKNQSNVPLKITETNTEKLENPITKTTTKTTTKDIYIVENDFSTKTPQEPLKKQKNNKKIDYDIKPIDDTIINESNIILDKPLSNNSDLEIYGSLVMQYLGKKIGKKYRKISKHVIARLREYSIMDLIDVIDFKYNEWNADEKMRNYLRPETLFNTEHFDTYLADAENVVKDKLFDEFLEKIMLPKIEKARKHGWQLKGISRKEWEGKYYERQRQKRIFNLLSSERRGHRAESIL